MANDLPSKTYTLSKSQLKKLIEVAGADTVKKALIQNGNGDASSARDFSVSRPQLESIIQRAGPDAISPALIQNGNAEVI
jgi:hypothetical protein